MRYLQLNPMQSFCGEVTIPGSKSFSNRMLLMAALGAGETRICNLLHSDDTRHMLEALKQLGVRWRREGDEVIVDGGQGCLGAIAGEDLELFLGNAGTAMRPLVAALALVVNSPLVVTGEPRMWERPIGPLVDALRLLGGRITYLKDEGFPPLRIEPRQAGPQPDEIVIDGSLSSQFISAMLMAMPLLGKPIGLRIEGESVSAGYIDLTVGLMKQFGVEISVQRTPHLVYRLERPMAYQGRPTMMVEGDASSATYFLAGAAIKGGPVRVRGVSRDSVQPDMGFLEVLRLMGAQVRVGEHEVEVSRGQLRGVDLDLNHMPDGAMTVAVLALFAEGATRIRHIYNWRLKETDRLAAMAAELRKVGAKVEEGYDELVVVPPKQLRRASIETYQDHRMAMCFSLLSLSPVGVTILDPGCTSKTYPGFFQDYVRLSLNGLNES